MSERPDGQVVRAPSALRWHRLPWRNPRDTLTWTVRYRGGSEAWVEVKARGATGRFHGSTSLFDVMAEICQWDRKPRSGS